MTDEPNAYPKWVMDKLRWLEYDYMPEGLPRSISKRVCLMAYEMVDALLLDPDAPEAVDQLLIGLQRLIDAKDPLVRVAIALGEADAHMASDASTPGPEAQHPGGPIIGAAQILLNAVRNPGEGLALQHEVLGEANDDAWGSVWLYGNWKHISTKMTNIERELAADAIMRWNERIGREDQTHDEIDPRGLRWWRY
jgi:hypothetical protein